MKVQQTSFNQHLSLSRTFKQTQDSVSSIIVNTQFVITAILVFRSSKDAYDDVRKNMILEY